MIGPTKKKEKKKLTEMYFFCVVQKLWVFRQNSNLKPLSNLNRNYKNKKLSSDG